MDKESHHICNLRRGDIASFEYLYNVWSGKLYNFVMRISRGDTYLTEEIVQSVFTTEKEVDYHLLEEYIDSLIEQLPSARREIFILSRRKLLTNREIAAKLNLSENTVESQLTKAIAFLRSKIDRHYSISIPLLLFLFID